MEPTGKISSKYDLKFNELIRLWKKREASDSKHSGIDNTIAYTILGLSACIAFLSRLYSVINFESIIHEFDPWFNYRCTKYLIENGIFKFFHWFDEQAWYPHGRHVGYTVYPGLMLTSGFIYKVLHFLALPIHIRDVCVFLSPIFSSFTVYSTYLLTNEIWNRKAALVSAFFISIAPGYISRSVAGSYDNEGIAIFALIFTFYLWLKAVKNSSVMWSLLTAFSYFYMVAAWGGYVFIINIIPLHVLAILLIEGYSDELYTVYCSFFVMAVILAMQVPFVGVHVVIKSSEHLASIGMFGLMQLFGARYHAHRIIRQKLAKKSIFDSNIIKKSVGADIDNLNSKSGNDSQSLDISNNSIKDFTEQELINILDKSFVLLVGFCLTGLFVLEMFGVILPWSGRFYSMFDTGYAKVHIPIIASVAEHQPTSWGSFIMDLHFLPIAMIFGVNLCATHYNSARIFAIIYALFASYFSGVMVRLILTLTPIACVLGSIAVTYTLDTLFKLDLNSEKVSKSSNINFKDSKDNLSKNNEKLKNNDISQSKNSNLKNNIKKIKNNEKLSKYNQQGFKTKNSSSLPISSIVSTVGIIGFSILLFHFMLHCGYVSRAYYSSPSVILSSQRADGSNHIIDDFREAYYWMDRNTAHDAKIASWWDYGYQIAGFSNRTTIVDNNTNNNRHIATVGKIMASDEQTSYPIIAQLEVDYLLVIFGGAIGFSGDDINKFLWMVRIGQGEFPEDIVESEFFSSNGMYSMGQDVSPRMRKSLMYKMSYYNFDKLKTNTYSNTGFDNVRRVEIGYKGFNLDTLEEVYTSKNWIVRIYKVKKPPVVFSYSKNVDFKHFLDSV